MCEETRTKDWQRTMRKQALRKWTETLVRGVNDVNPEKFVIWKSGNFVNFLQIGCPTLRRFRRVGIKNFLYRQSYCQPTKLPDFQNYKFPDYEMTLLSANSFTRSSASCSCTWNRRSSESVAAVGT